MGMEGEIVGIGRSKEIEEQTTRNVKS